MRRILVTLAVSIFSLTAPLAPSAAGARPVNPPHPPIPRANARLLSFVKIHDHRHWLERESHQSLEVVARHFHLTLAQLVDKWQRVAICEVDGNWSMKGPYYSGIGFANSTWVRFGGVHFAPTAGDATPVEQVLIGMRVTRTWIPDQYGCAPGGW